MSSEACPYSVSSLTAELKHTLETKFNRIFVEAEISGYRLYPSGHAYFTLKDQGSQISAVMFASSLTRCKVRDRLKDGAKVVVYGNVSVYPPRGQYQLMVLAVKLVEDKLGEMARKLEELKAKLKGEGLFDSSHKRALPFLMRRIAIVTSAQGRVIYDICDVLRRRFPAVEVRLFPSLVQGNDAPPTVVRGIEYFNAPSPDGWRADVLIVARGGGSFEDLYCFNDERLVRAVASSKIPTISAVGHESDYTLCDAAADVRAGTPSIAAEMVTPRTLGELEDRLSKSLDRLTASLRNRGEYFAQRLDQLSDALGTTLRHRGEYLAGRLDKLSAALQASVRLHLVRTESRLSQAATKLAAYSPYGVLDRGYSLTTAVDGTVVKDAARLKRGELVTTRLAHGEFKSVVR